MEAQHGRTPSGITESEVPGKHPGGCGYQVDSRTHSLSWEYRSGNHPINPVWEMRSHKKMQTQHRRPGQGKKVHWVMKWDRVSGRDHGHSALGRRPGCWALTRDWGERETRWGVARSCLRGLVVKREENAVSGHTLLNGGLTEGQMLSRGSRQDVGIWSAWRPGGRSNRGGGGWVQVLLLPCR